MSDTREKIIEAAKKLFETNGFSGTTTKEISQKAGVSEVTLFRHFETKRNLFEQTVHSCMHPYMLREYMKKHIEYNLKKDLKVIAFSMLKTFQQNIPLLKMVFKDRMKGSVSKMHLLQEEHNAKSDLKKYFEQMHRMGKMKADPKMAIIFFINNITGYFMKNLFSLNQDKINKDYFEWMIDKVIFALEN